MPKVSIVVPVYKVEKYLEQCVTSLENQTLTDIEIILVDDGSPDNCPDLCDKFTAEDNRIRTIHKQNAGVSAARNDGLKIAKGEYVIFCDADDFMELTGCEELYTSAKEEDADIVIGDVYQIVNGEKIYTDFYANEFMTEDRDFVDELIKADFYRTFCPLPPTSGPAFGYGGPWNKLVRRTMINNNNILFDMRVKGIFDDIIYTAYILSTAKRIVYIKKPVYNYRMLTNSITHSYKPNAIEINNAIFQCFDEFLSRQNNGKKFMEAYYACVLRRLEESLRLYFLNKDNEHDKKYLKAELKTLINTSPYKDAIRKVNLIKVSKKQSLIAMLSRMKLITAIFDIQILRKRYS